jgi:hypothetical protein
MALTTLRQPDGTLEPFSLSYVPLLERVVSRAGDVKLVVVDPITSYIGGKVDDHRNSALRVLLEPLAEMAARLMVAIVIVTHLNKGASANAINRVTGSLAYIALARAAWLVVRDPDDDPRRLFLSIKNNLAPDPSGLAYRIDANGRLAWEDQAISQTANDVLREQSKGDRGDREEKGPTKGKQAVEWLDDLFKPGVSLPSEEVFRLGEVAGLKRNPLFEAKKQLGIRAVKSPEHNGAWVWRREEPLTQSRPPNGSTVQRFNGSPF